MWLYALVLLISVSVPFALSFDKRLAFYKQWKYVFPAIFVVAAIYIAFDVYFTNIGVWRFNSEYHANILLLGLPLEEWLFFVAIPYACVFLHEAWVLYFPKARLGKQLGKVISTILLLAMVAVVIFNFGKIYTVYAFGLVAIALLLSFAYGLDVLRHFYVTFLIMLIPFLIVNSILTGSFTERCLVCYNDGENLGVRLFTIPVEDFGYAFGMILFNLLLINKLKKRRSLHV